ncbi:methyltransferase domain-containing protein [Lyngbya aestuarii]|uniref:methyltransferase domain-containing protein n=1 Tax=Lyngbya aestuarii TaxID=118322 RepID=UPI00403DE4F9
MPRKTIEKIYEESWTAYLDKGKGQPTLDNKFGVSIAEMVGYGQKVLDIGCGTGKCMLPLVDQGNEVVGIDVSDTALTVLNNLGFQTFKLDIESDSIEILQEYAPFDVVIMTDVLEHLIDPLVVLKDKVYPLLQANGKCIATVPNFVYLNYRLEFLLGRISHFNNDDSTGHDIPRLYNLGHKTMFNQSNLKQTFQQAGFSAVKVEPELFAETLKEYYKMPLLRDIRLILKKAWPTLLAARFLTVAQK